MDPSKIWIAKDEVILGNVLAVHTSRISVLLGGGEGSERRRALRLELIPSPRLTKRGCSRDEDANQSGESRQEGTCDPGFVGNLNSPLPPSRPLSLRAPLSAKWGGYFPPFTRVAGWRGGGHADV